MVVLAVNFWDEDKETLAAFVKEHKLQQKILLEGRVVGSELYGVSGIPTSFWIDSNGVVVDSHAPSEPGGFGSLDKKTARLLSRK